MCRLAVASCLAVALLALAPSCGTDRGARELGTADAPVAGDAGLIDGDAGGGDGGLGGDADASSDLQIHVATTGSDDASGSAQDPFATLSRALEAVATLKAGGVSQDIHVWIHAGLYSLGGPIQFGAGNCGGASQRVTVSGVPNEPAPVLSGAKTVPQAAWSETSPGSGVWVTAWSNPAVRALIGGSKPLVRAREPNTLDPSGSPAVAGWLDNAYHQLTLPISATALLPSDARGFEVVMPMGWSLSRLRILAFAQDPASGLAYLSPEHPEGSIEADKAALKKGGMGPVHLGVQRAWLEGHPALLDAPGEWAVDATANQLMVRPTNPEALGDILVPSLERLAVFDACENVTVEHVAFAHAAWESPSAQGYVGVGVGQHYVRNASGDLSIEPDHAAVQLRNAQGVVFRRVSFSELGGRGVEMLGGRGNRLEQCRFARTSSTALVMEAEDDAVVEQNVFVEIGAQYGGDAIAALSAKGARIEHNYIANVASRAVYAFDGYFLDVAHAAGDNGFVGNRVWKAVELTTDTGALNFGGANGFAVRGNALAGISPSGWNPGGGHVVGVYLDIGSYLVSVRDNAVSVTDLAFQLNCQAYNAVEGNEVAVAGPDPTKVTYSACTLFQGAMTAASWELLSGQMLDAGCAIDVDAGTEQCPCNASGTCWTSSLVQLGVEGSAAAQQAWDASGPDPQVLAHWGVTLP